jgi:hypothetical protein
MVQFFSPYVKSLLLLSVYRFFLQYALSGAKKFAALYTGLSIYEK